MSRRSLHFALQVLPILSSTDQPISVSLAFSCEFRYDKCCISATAAMELACADTEAKNGTIIPEFATLTKNIALHTKVVFDPYDSAGTDKFMNLYSGTEPSPPVAMVGPTYSSRAEPLSQSCQALGVSQVTWVTAPFWFENPMYSGVFRLSPTDVGAVAALYQVLRLKQIHNVAFLVTSADVWGLSLLKELKRLCAGTQHLCKTTLYEVPYEVDENLVGNVLGKIIASGLRTIINAVISRDDLSVMLGVASKIGIVGTSKGAKGYLWLFPWVPWGDALGDPVLGLHSTLWSGVIGTGFPMSSIRPEKLGVFSQHWRQMVPSLRVDRAGGQQLGMESAYSPQDCLLSIHSAYDSVARVRMALERVNLSLPSSPGQGLQSREWWGTLLKRELQSGTTINGLYVGPDLRKSPAPGMPWEENNASFVLFNYLDGVHGNIELYKATPSGLVAGKDVLRGKLPGGIAFNTPGVGLMQKTACNGVRNEQCRSLNNFGSCQLAGHVGLSPGWCKCDAGHVGRFCEDQSIASMPPVSDAKVLTNFTLQVVSFGGLSKDGDSFTVTLSIKLAWHDRRFPWDTGEYIDGVADTLLTGWWKPEVEISGVLSHLDKTLRVVRNPNEEATGKASNVVISLESTVLVTHSFRPSFEQFPFDRHKLFVQVTTVGTNTELRLVPGTVVLDSAMSRWNGEWKPLVTEGPWNAVEHGHADSSFRLMLFVQRSYELTVYRLLAPLTVLVIVSWSAFWIRPAALMPRFASGFISFLALQGFKTYAVQMMPNSGQIDAVSWIDIYISFVGFMTGLSVVETVCVQYVSENFSPLVGRAVDKRARYSFPALYVVVMTMMCVSSPLKDSGATLNIVVHATVASFVFLFFSYVAFEVYFFPCLSVRRMINLNASGARRHKQWKLLDTELHIMYEHLERRDGQKRTGAVQTETLVKWLLHVKPLLAKHVMETRVLAETTFGQDTFRFPVFKEEFSLFLTKLTVIIHHPDELYATTSSTRRSNPKRSEIVAAADYLVEGDEEDELENDLRLEEQADELLGVDGDEVFGADENDAEEVLTHPIVAAIASRRATTDARSRACTDASTWCVEEGPNSRPFEVLSTSTQKVTAKPDAHEARSPTAKRKSAKAKLSSKYVQSTSSQSSVRGRLTRLQHILGLPASGSIVNDARMVATECDAEFTDVSTVIHHAEKVLGVDSGALSTAALQFV